MVHGNLDSILTSYKNIYTQLKSTFKWHADDKIFMLVAAMYMVNHREFDLKRYKTLTNDIKNKSGVFSYLRSTQRFTTAATIDISCSDSKEGFEKLSKIYEGLIESGFSRTPYTYIAAGTLLKTEDSLIDMYAQKSHDIYRGMKEQHFFLTGAGDYPLAALLAQGEELVTESIYIIEQYYDRLQRNGFYKGDSLQFLSHILSLVNNPDPDEIVTKCIRVMDLLKNKGVKVKRSYYPFVGILALVEDIDDQIDSIQYFQSHLNSDKRFRWQKDINFMIAVVFKIMEKTEFEGVATTGLNTSIEAIIQAQQAAIIASISAYTASTSSIGGE